MRVLHNAIICFFFFQLFFFKLEIIFQRERDAEWRSTLKNRQQHWREKITPGTVTGWEAATPPSCLITLSSLPCLLLLIFRAALQYFYQMISLLVCGPYVYENDTLQECLLHAKMSLPFLIALISVCIQAHLCEGGGWCGVTTDWLALFIIMRCFILGL